MRGNLVTLHATGGNFSASTDSCLANNATAPTLSYALSPTAGQGFWFLVRGTRNGCSNGNGTYDTGAPSQVGSRDPGVNASASSCP